MTVSFFTSWQVLVESARKKYALQVRAFAEIFAQKSEKLCFTTVSTLTNKRVTQNKMLIEFINETIMWALNP